MVPERIAEPDRRPRNRPAVGVHDRSRERDRHPHREPHNRQQRRHRPPPWGLGEREGPAIDRPILILARTADQRKRLLGVPNDRIFTRAGYRYKCSPGHLLRRVVPLRARSYPENSETLADFYATKTPFVQIVLGSGLEIFRVFGVEAASLGPTPGVAPTCHTRTVTRPATVSRRTTPGSSAACGPGWPTLPICPGVGGLPADRPPPLRGPAGGSPGDRRRLARRPGRRQGDPCRGGRDGPDVAAPSHRTPSRPGPRRSAPRPG